MQSGSTDSEAIPDTAAHRDIGRPGVRVGQVVRLRPEHAEEYIELHRAVWPDVLTMISECNITDYSIFHRDGLLFAYFVYVGSDWQADTAKMAADPTTKRWWELTDPCQQPVEGHDSSRPWAPMTEVFHHD